MGRKKTTLSVNREIREALVAVLIRLQACRAAADGSEENDSAKYREPDGPQESTFDLIQQVRNAYRKSVWAQRDKDENGPRLTFGILEKPTKHLVALQTEEDVDIIFEDGPTIAERCGCMKWLNNYNFFYTCFAYTIGILLQLSVLPMSVFVMAGVWKVDLAIEHTFLICWNIYFVLNLTWMIFYILCYGNIQAMAATLRANLPFPCVSWFQPGVHSLLHPVRSYALERRGRFKQQHCHRTSQAIFWCNCRLYENATNAGRF